jgi:hypothetical protein
LDNSAPVADAVPVEETQTGQSMFNPAAEEEAEVKLFPDDLDNISKKK